MNEWLLVYYPNCDTCRKAKKWLEAKDVSFTLRHIVDETPTVKELAEWVERSGEPLTKLFNTSGQKYRELGLKEKVKQATREQLLDILASDGMLIKRPLLIGQSTALIGFKEAEYEQKVVG